MKDDKSTPTTRQHSVSAQNNINTGENFPNKKKEKNQKILYESYYVYCRLKR